MPKYVRTLVKKSSIVPWLTDEVLTANSSHLTEAEKTLLVDAATEGRAFPGFIGYETSAIGNTQIISYEFDTLENLNNFIDKNFNRNSGVYDDTLKLPQYYSMIAKKVEELGLKNSYTVVATVVNE